jgi:hypothetical protein
MRRVRFLGLNGSADREARRAFERLSAVGFGFLGSRRDLLPETLQQMFVKEVSIKNVSQKPALGRGA